VEVVITITFGETDMGVLIKQALAQVPKQAKQVMASAMTGTAKEARDILAAKAQETYTIKTVRFNRAAQVKPASASSLEAYIRASGRRIGSTNFKHSAGRGAPARLQVLQSGSLKPLGVPGRMGFKARLNSGNVHLVRRETTGRWPLKVFTSPSVPQMLGSLERVINPTEPEISEILYKHVNEAIGKLLGGTA